MLNEKAYTTFSSFSNYPTIQSKAARLSFGLIKNHPFVDGNKRIGILAMVSFLEVNGIKLFSTDAELIDLGIRLADGSLGEKAILDFIIEHFPKTFTTSKNHTQNDNIKIRP